MALLFKPVEIGPLVAPNRIAISPMCQYSAVDGLPTEWHLQNAMTLAMSGAGVVMLEATAVEPRGRITHGCLGLWSDAHQAAVARIVAAMRTVAPGGTLLGIQLAHAGRKGSARRPWEGGKPLGEAENPWRTRAPSRLAFDADWPVPEELTTAEICTLLDAFAAAAGRAMEAGFDIVELHMAHGYLLHQFLSPLSNRRGDLYGTQRLKFPTEVARAVRDTVPGSRAVGARITGTDWLEGGWNVADAAALARGLEALGFGYVCVSSGGIMGTAKIPIGPGYQVPLAHAVKQACGLKVRTVGMIADPAQAEAVIAGNHADMIAIARAAIDDPRWPWHAAFRLGAEIARPHPYARAAPAAWPAYKLAHAV
jgi:2,4-dienoyl-CoA reductase-like NADH-dependent reductase (Old Yellow Enzyme family)